MLKYAMTLGMFVGAGLLLAIGSAAPTTLVGLGMLGLGLGMEITAWHRVALAHRSKVRPH